MTVKSHKKLIEVALPLQIINTACVAEGSPFTPRHPRSLHVWWARRRLAAARAVIFAQMVDDPSSNPDLFPTEKKQERERQRLFKIIEELVQWENTSNEKVLQQARDEIWQSWRRACAENVEHPRAKELFNRTRLPAFHDPFAGGGALPLEAQRLGLESYASDLNPVAVLINKGMIELPAIFAGKAPVNPEWQNKTKEEKALMQWKGAQGLAEDIRYYGNWIREQAQNRIGHLYPQIEITPEMAKERPDLKRFMGQKLIVTAWLWTRTVRSPNPAFRNVHVPLASTFLVSSKAGKEAYVEPVVEKNDYRFIVHANAPKNVEAAKNGMKLARGAHFKCVMSGIPIKASYIYEEGKAGRMGARLMCIVAETENGRVYLSPTPDHEKEARRAKPDWRPDVSMPENPRWFSPPLYGLTTYGDLFTPRQLTALNTYIGLIAEAVEQSQAADPEHGKSGAHLRDGGNGPAAYSETLATYFGLALSRWTDLFSSLSAWNSTNQNIKNLFSRHAIPMVWDFAESNPFGAGASFNSTIETIYRLFTNLPATPLGHAFQMDATTQSLSGDKVVSTDPPYFDNIGYAELSDFFYVWLRRALRPLFPDLFATVAVPKADELVATAYRHGGKQKAEEFFLTGMKKAMQCMAQQAHPAFPSTIYYAFKQTETDDETGTASTGWETFLEAVTRAGFRVSGTWPIRTERTDALKKNINALASSVILVCRPLSESAPTIGRREFLAELKRELPKALHHLQAGNVAPVDLAQSAIGPGMAVFTRYSRVLDAQGNSISVREALALINEVLDEALTEQEGDFDADSRWALAWFEQHGFAEGEFGVAETLSKAKNTSVRGLEDAGILESKRGKVRLLEPEELPDNWSPETDKRLTNWETVHHLIRVLNKGGERAASELVSKLGSKAETARELAYRLYTLCERKKRSAEALSYNGLVQSWPELVRLAREAGSPQSSAAVEQELGV